jgi:oligoribonuclease NrnB/cAMP/cGMP phosphodiesterase (DHH superfamily)
MSKLYKIFTHGDLDGAVSLLSLMWAKPTDVIEYEELFNNTIEERLLKYKEKTINIPTTIVMDFSLRESFLNLDIREFIFVDHHKSSASFVDKFKQAKIVFKETTSNTALIYNSFIKNLDNISKEQKYLIALANDFDCYKLELEESYDLNILFWSEYRGNFNKFIRDYKNGFKPFTEKQKQIISLEKEHACSLSEKLQRFSGSLNIKGKSYKTIAVIGEKYNVLVIDCLMRNYNPDIFFFINTKTEKVNMRKKPDIAEIDMGLFAEKFCEGGGNSNSSGGKLTPIFMELMKNLKPQ